MTEILANPEEREQQFNRGLIAEYLKYGSVDEVFRKHDYCLPISYPGFQRLLDKWAIVKAAGPNTRLSEALAFFTRLTYEKIPLERLYKDMPPSFRTSMGTLHRILSYVRSETIRRVGCALVITPEGRPQVVLVGNDVATPRLNVGKPFGSISLPMGYSRRTESHETSILRVLQQEVFTEQAINRNLPLGELVNEPKPFMFVDIADVRVAVYHLTLPVRLSGPSNFSSFKITNHRFIHLSQILKGQTDKPFRVGICEIGLGYQKFLDGPAQDFTLSPILTKSLLNLALLELFIDHAL
mgnify:CR=1 FL=1